ncbi:MAG: thioredoxin domain-containing protein [Ornithinimicrobium sp.]
MSNRLAAATSPYLLQHADNPVDWWPWTPEAFSHARERNVPILLSIGYAACHWCHVMAHESFEDQQLAEQVNADFVAIKVDREERPDVDAVYMQATTAMTGHGGWPMTCLLTPLGEPFWCGTYLPKVQFSHLLSSAAQTWSDREDEVRAGGAHIVHTLSRAAEAAESSQVITAEVLDGAVDGLQRDFDSTHGGFGGAPKFPPSMVLSFLLRHSARTGDERADTMARQTLRAMARSGTYDQIGGGFARYAVDAAWVVPHFEKMLYDNALLLRSYTDLARVSHTTATADDAAMAERIVRESVDWLLREMWTEQAGFASSLDADTDGVEGATYVWTPEQLAQVLGEADGQRAAEFFVVTPRGTFEHGTSTLQRPREPEDERWYADVRERLDLHRTLRAQPGRDDKVVTAWNGWLIAALAEAGWFFGEPDWIDVAARCADLLLRVHVVDRRLRRSSRDGVVGEASAVAEDYGGLAEGLLALHAATADRRWLDSARWLLDTARSSFGPESDDGAPSAALPFHDSAGDVTDLVMRPRSRGDNAEPCGQSALAGALLRYGALAGSTEHLDQGRSALEPMGSIATQAPRFAGWALSAAEDALSGPVVLAVASADGSLSRASRHAPPGTMVLTGPVGDAAGLGDDVPPMLEQRPALQGHDTAYLCRGTVCQPPTNDPRLVIESLLDRDWDDRREQAQRN